MIELILIVCVFVGFVGGLLVRRQEVNDLKDVIRGYKEILNTPFPDMPKRHTSEDDEEFARRAACFFDAVEEIYKNRQH
jgi:hypothetical protein